MGDRDCGWCGRPLGQEENYCKACVDVLNAFAQVGAKHAMQIARDAADGCELATRVQGEAFMMIQTERTDAFLEAYGTWKRKRGLTP